MANHAPVMTTVKPGIVTVRSTDGREERYVVFGGFADILPSGCTLLAESATRVGDINRDEIARRIEAAREEAAGAKDDPSRSRAEEFLHHLAALQDAV
jgi:F-type H+-transporting ATPase subunit epsilon